MSSLASVSALSPEDQNAMQEYTDMVNLPLLFQTMIEAVTTDQPDDPHAFLIDWLEKTPIHMKRRIPANFRQTIKEMFRHADMDKSGFLDRKELKSVFIGLRNELGLSDADIRMLMANADENADGVIDYEEFSNVAVDALQAIYLKLDYEAELAYRKEEARQETSENLLRGMTEEQLKNILLNVFQNADKDQNGYLDPKEFRSCLNDTALGFTKKEINIMLSEVDADNDGKITYDEFAPLAFDILVELMSKEFLGVPTGTEELQEFFEEMFLAQADAEGNIAHAAAEAAMLDAKLGLTQMQVLACLAEEQGTDSISNAQSLAATVAAMVAQVYESWGY